MEDRAIVETRGNGGNGCVSLFEFTSIDRAWKFSEQLARSEIIPDTFRGNPASCLIALDMANRMRRNPMEVMQAIYIVHGKPSFSSSFLIGLINSCGLFERLRFEWTGEPGTEGRGCRAVTVERRTGEKLEGPLITMRMAKEEGWTGKNPKWRTMPDVMLTYRAASFFSRAYCPDLTGGFHSNDELVEAELRAESASTAETIQAQLVAEPETPVSQAQDGAAELEASSNGGEGTATEDENYRAAIMEMLAGTLDWQPSERSEFFFRVTRKYTELEDMPHMALLKVLREAQREVERRTKTS